MNTLSLIATLCACVANVSVLHGQPRQTVRGAALDIMRAAQYATLVTNGRDGQPQARIVEPRLGATVDTVWVVTNPQSRKVAELRRDARVTLLFFNQQRGEYATVLGRATTVTDSAEIARHWKPEWSPFYPARRTKQNVAMYAVRVFQLEVVSPSRGIRSDSATWRPVVERVP